MREPEADLGLSKCKYDDDAAAAAAATSPVIMNGVNGNM
jgi:hypothetical protein